MPFRKRNYLTDLQVKIAQLRAGARFEDSMGLFILSQLRNHLEQNTIRDQGEYIKFYANWMLHPQIDRNTTGRGVVQDLIEVLKDGLIPPQRKTQEMNRRLGHEVLKREMRVFFEQNHIDQFFLTDNNWRQFFSQISRLLILKPINLQNAQDAYFAENEIPGVDYAGYPVLWLNANPGEPIETYIACVRADVHFTEELVQNHEENDILIFQSGLYWDAL